MKTTLALLLLIASVALASELHVSPTGDDNDPGTAAKPLRTLAAACKANGGTVWLHAGIYYLPETLVLTAENSGTTFAAVPGDEVVISGGARLDLKWEPFKAGILQAKVPAGLTTDQLFVNGQRQMMARYPNFDPNVRPFGGFAADAFSKERAARWSDPAGGFIQALQSAHWSGYSYRITGKNDKGEITYEGGWQDNRPKGMHPQHRFVENIFEELDAPGEWFLNPKTATLYCFPPAGVDLKTATIEIVRLRHLIECNGAKHVTLRGFIFRHTARTFMDTKERLLRSDWAIYRGGALFFTGTEDCTVEDCVLDQLGGNAIFVNNYNRRLTVRGCHILQANASGLVFVGDPQAVRNPWFDFNQRQDYSAIDQTPGPKSDNYPADCLVEDCLIHETGQVEKQSAPVEIDMAQSITIRHCSIYDVPRAGINIGDGCWGGHVIEFCDIFDTVKETGDHGSFNSWGRDRYWGLLNVPAGELPKLALLDVVKPNTIRNNRWRCEHGWAVDLDDGSSNYQIYNNLFLNGGLKLREGFQRHVWNNITVNNSLHQHVWFENSGDVVTNNIWMAAYRPVGGPKGKWGQEIDYNLFTTSAADRTKCAAHGCDEHSLVGDAMFIDSATGDFRVNDGSPALKLGFKNFPMDQFGVQKASLKKLARTPSFAAAKAEVSKRDSKVCAWHGGKIKNLIGLGEVSAAGLSGEIGVRVEQAPPHTALRDNDVILKCNGNPMNAVGDLLRIASGRLKLEVWRDQKNQTIEVEFR